MNTILVTAATGTVGSTLVPRLQARDVHVRALVRDADRARSRLGDGVELRVGDFDDPASLRAAVEGVDAVFLACPNLPDQVRYECAVIDAAAAAGVSRVVKLSARGAEVNAPVAFWHWHGLIERHLLASGVPAVVLQPGFLMTNLLAAADAVRYQGMVFAPALDAHIAMIDPTDVAAAAAVALTSDGYDGTHVLTGPDAVTYEQVAADLTDATGRSVGFVPISPEAAVPAMIDAGVPAFAAEQIVRVFEALRRGAQAVTTSGVEDITGQPPRTFAAFARDYADAFRPAPASAQSAWL